MSSREEVTAKIVSNKVEFGLTWKGIATELGASSPILYRAALLGQMTLTAEEAAKVAEIFDLRGCVVDVFTGTRSDLDHPADRSLIYRFYELVQNYGTTWKALIEEQFGDGIMRAIDFNMSIEREADPKGDRVKIEMSGKFLPFKRSNRCSDLKQFFVEAADLVLTIDEVNLQNPVALLPMLIERVHWQIALWMGIGAELIVGDSLVRKLPDEVSRYGTIELPSELLWERSGVLE